MSNIDNLYDILSGRKSWEDLSDDELRVLERSPAAAPQPVHQQPLEVIEGNFPNVYQIDPRAAKTPQQKVMIEETANPTLALKKKYASDLASNMMESRASLDLAQKRFGDLSKEVSEYQPKKFESGPYERNMKVMQGEYDKIQDPQRDILSQAILSFGPALLGSMTGEAGAISAPKTQNQAQGLYEAARKEDLVHNEKLRDNISKRIDALAKMKEQDIKLWQEQGKNEADNLKNKILSAKDYVESLYRSAQMDQNAYEKMQGQLDNMLIKFGVPTMKTDSEKSKSQVKTSSEERKAASYYGSVVQSNKVLEELGGEGGKDLPSLKDKFFYLKSSSLGGRDKIPLSQYLMTYVKDPNVRRQLSAESNWVINVLRPESGAAISVGEFSGYGNDYFPRYGDSPQVIEDKRAKRLQKEEGLRLMAGSAPLPKIIQPKNVEPSQGKEIKVIGGKKYEKVKGGWQLVK